MSNFGKRVDGPQGRRRATREKLLLAAAVDTVGSSSQVTLHDLSATGARLAGSGLPPAGGQLLIRTAGLTIFGDVAWQTEDGCGVKFVEPLSKHEIAVLRKDGRELRLMVISPEERQAAEDWSSGFAR